MIGEAFEVTAIMLAAAVAGMFFGPWAALTRSAATIAPETFIPVVRRLSINMAQVMTVLMPLSLVSILPILAFSLPASSARFWMNVAALVLLVIALVVTMVIEVPLVKQMEGWSMTTLPEGWTAIRDRWVSFHLVRILCGVLALLILLCAALFGG